MEFSVGCSGRPMANIAKHPSLLRRRFGPDLASFGIGCANGWKNANLLEATAQACRSCLLLLKVLAVQLFGLHRMEERSM